jgi:DNA-binding transcriptional MerR regulator
MITVGKLAEMFGLSRATLLYYDRIKLLSPTTRSPKGYRLYGEDRVAELRLICTYKSVGLTLNEIRELVSKPGEPDKGILRKRIIELDKDISNLRNQQRALTELLKSIGDIAPTGSLDKDTWVAILRSSGMDQDDMQRWHEEFERNAPEAHHCFLRWLGISEEEVLEIRAGSKST